MTDLQPAPKDFPMVDTWQFERLAAPEVLAAYKTLMDNQVIRFARVRISEASGIATVSYYSSLPREWTLGALQKAKADYLKNRPVEQRSFL